MITVRRCEVAHWLLGNHEHTHARTRTHLECILLACSPTSPPVLGGLSIMAPTWHSWPRIHHSFPPSPSERMHQPAPRACQGFCMDLNLWSIFRKGGQPDGSACLRFTAPYWPFTSASVNGCLHETILGDSGFQCSAHVLVITKKTVLRSLLASYHHYHHRGSQTIHWATKLRTPLARFLLRRKRIRRS